METQAKKKPVAVNKEVKAGVHTIFVVDGPSQSGKSYFIEHYLIPAIKDNQLTKNLEVAIYDCDQDLFWKDIEETLLFPGNPEFIIIELPETRLDFLTHLGKMAEKNFYSVSLDFMNYVKAGLDYEFDLEVTNISDYDSRFLSSDILYLPLNSVKARNISTLVEYIERADFRLVVRSDEKGISRITGSESENVNFIINSDDLLFGKHVKSRLLDFIYPNAGKFKVLKGKDKPVKLDDELDIAKLKILIDDSKEFFISGDNLYCCNAECPAESRGKMDEISLLKHIG